MPHRIRKGRSERRIAFSIRLCTEKTRVVFPEASHAGKKRPGAAVARELTEGRLCEGVGLVEEGWGVPVCAAYSLLLAGQRMVCAHTHRWSELPCLQECRASALQGARAAKKAKKEKVKERLEIVAKNLVTQRIKVEKVEQAGFGC